MSKPKSKQYVPQPGQRATIDPTLFTGRRPAARGPTPGGPPALTGNLVSEQGPTQAGGTLAGITAPGVSRDIIQSRYGPRIDLGPILRPQSTGANPWEGDPFKATSGVGGFFRRLLGDNSDELNAQWQQARMQREMAGQSLAEQRAFELEKLKLADQLAGTREAAGREFTKELQGQQQGFQLGQAMNKEIADAADRAAQNEFIKGQNLQRDIFETLKQDAEHAQRTKELGMRGDTTLDRAMLGGGRAATPGKWGAVGDMFTDPSGNLMRFDFESNSMVPVPLGAQPGGAGGAPTQEQMENARAAAAKQKVENDKNAPNAPVSALSGLGATLEQLTGDTSGAVTDPNIAGGKLVMDALSGLGDYFNSFKSAGGQAGQLQQQAALEKILAEKRANRKK